MLLDFSYPHVVEEAHKHKYRVLSCPNDLMIVGWRNKHARLDRFDCWIATYRHTQAGVETLRWPATTYPGLPYLLNPIMPKGTATLVPGQYENSHSLGWYKGYKTLRQWGPVKVYRDANKDEVRDLENVDCGLFGIHIHKAGAFSKIVGNWSAGCQVFQNSSDFDTFIGICQKHKDALANMFTYTLLEF